jgi:hypothetical protein
MLAIFYYLSHSTSPSFALVIFEIRSCFMTRPAWTLIFLFVLPHVAGITDTHHHDQSLIEMRSHEFFPGLASNHGHVDLHFPSTWDYRLEPPCLAKEFLF